MKSLLNFVSTLLVWWKRQTISTRIVTYFYGNLIGEDSHGNQYYVSNGKVHVHDETNFHKNIKIEMPNPKGYEAWEPE